MKTIKSFARVWPERKAKPTQRQRELAAEIQKKLGLEVELPEDAKAYRQFINNHMSGKSGALSADDKAMAVFNWWVGWHSPDR